MKITVDRFEGDFAVVELEDGNMVDMPKVLIPANANEGDIIEITIKHDDSFDRSRKITKLMNETWED